MSIYIVVFVWQLWAFFFALLKYSTAHLPSMLTNRKRNISSSTLSNKSKNKSYLDFLLMSLYINYSWLCETRQSRLLLIGTAHISFIHSFIHSFHLISVVAKARQASISLLSFSNISSIWFPIHQCKRRRKRRKKKRWNNVLFFFSFFLFF